ncbi:hypothetical protein EVAR_37280_1 [Eumeta japonica]|uniref:Uncharacterized protein n=1 Tax=Eumeta variegata TaxID=151549 RepID=A0A4C1WMU6_EUMVA|nr:hypothetical protein EVAR_37280_1 [Eumeta japonica]
MLQRPAGTLGTLWNFSPGAENRISPGEHSLSPRFRPGACDCLIPVIAVLIPASLLFSNLAPSVFERRVSCADGFLRTNWKSDNGESGSMERQCGIEMVKEGEVSYRNSPSPRKQNSGSCYYTSVFCEDVVSRIHLMKGAGTFSYNNHLDYNMAVP